MTGVQTCALPITRGDRVDEEKETEMVVVCMMVVCAVFSPSCLAALREGLFVVDLEVDV